MNRKEFIKIMGAVATAAALGNIGFAEEGKKKMSKSIVVYFSHTGENYSVGVITVGNTAKVAKEIAAAHGRTMAQEALAWMLSKPEINAPIVGSTSERHIEEAVSALDVRLAPEEIAALETPYVPHVKTGAF